jgi:tetratricopeptide (TPR) repeat protein
MAAPGVRGQESGDIEERVLSSILAFEQILEALPDDKTALETLIHVYEEIGDYAKARDYLKRLGKVVLAEGDGQAAEALVEKVRAHGEEDPRLREIADGLADLAAGQTAGAESTGLSAAQSDAQRRATARVNIADEISLAWNMLEANVVTQDEYARIVQDLTEMSAGEGASNATVSVFHVLGSQGAKNLDRLLGFVAESCGTPVISLSHFELQNDATSLLPFAYMVTRGVLIFDLVSREALAVIMNPYNAQLRSDVETLAGRKCHFFLTPPGEFDQALAKIPDALSGKTAARKS